MSARPPPTRPDPGPAPARTSPLLSSPLSLLLAGLLSLLFVYITAWDLLRSELGTSYDWVLPRSFSVSELRRAVDWDRVGRGVWSVVDPRQAYVRGQGFGAMMRTKGGEAVRQLRDRLEL